MQRNTPREDLPEAPASDDSWLQQLWFLGEDDERRERSTSGESETVGHAGF